jgi:hypothetical protein
LEYVHICAYDRAVTSFSTDSAPGSSAAKAIHSRSSCAFAEGLTELRAINPDEPPHLTRSVVLTEDR